MVFIAGRGEASCDELGDEEDQQLKAECTDPKLTSDRALCGRGSAALAAAVLGPLRGGN